MALKEVVTSLFQKGVIKLVVNLHSPGFYSWLFLAPKRDGGNRPVIDLSYLNNYLKVDNLKMETTSSIMVARKQLGNIYRPQGCVFSYSNGPEVSMKYLHFVVNG